MGNEIIDFICSSNGNFRDQPYANSKYYISSELISPCIEKSITERIADIEVINQEYKKTKAIICEMELLLKNQYYNVDVCEYTSLENWLKGLFELTNLSKKGYFVKESKIYDLISNNKPIETMKSLNIDSVSKLFDELNICNTMCLTRVFEDENWHKKQYELYSLLQADDFEERGILINIFNPAYFKIPPERLYQKKTIWADKISGTIFGVPYLFNDKKLVPYMRLSTRLFHYIYELLLHNKYINNILSSPTFGAQFSRYINDNSADIDFFEPHFLFETFVWQFAMDEYYNIFQCLKSKMDEVKIRGVLFNPDNRATMISYDVNDMISNFCKERKVPGEHRMLSMKIKKELLSIKYSDEQLLEMLMKSLGHGNIFI